MYTCTDESERVLIGNEAQLLTMCHYQQVDIYRIRQSQIEMPAKIGLQLKQR